jgi:hypothetical protein
LKHPDKHADGSELSTRTVDVQILYGFKGDRVVLKVLPDNAPTSLTGGYERYMAQVALRQPVGPTVYQLPTDKKQQSHFLSFTHWGSLLEGKDITLLRTLVVTPNQGERYYPILAGCRGYYREIAMRLPSMGDLFLRWIKTTGS